MLLTCLVPLRRNCKYFFYSWYFYQLNAFTYSMFRCRYHTNCNQDINCNYNQSCLHCILKHSNHFILIQILEIILILIRGAHRSVMVSDIVQYSLWHLERNLYCIYYDVTMAVVQHNLMTSYCYSIINIDRFTN